MACAFASPNWAIGVRMNFVRSTIRRGRRYGSTSDWKADLVARAIGHELYHHREAIGEIGVLANKRAREAAADAYAARLAEDST